MGANRSVDSRASSSRVMLGAGAFSLASAQVLLTGNLSVAWHYLEHATYTGRCSGYAAKGFAEGYGLEAGINTRLEWFVSVSRNQNLFEGENWYIQSRFGARLNDSFWPMIRQDSAYMILFPILLVNAGMFGGYAVPLDSKTNLVTEVGYSLDFFSSALTARVGLEFSR